MIRTPTGTSSPESDRRERRHARGALRPRVERHPRAGPRLPALLYADPRAGHGAARNSGACALRLARAAGPACAARPRRPARPRTRPGSARRTPAVPARVRFQPRARTSPSDQGRAAARTACSALAVVHVAGVDVAQAVAERDRPRAASGSPAAWAGGPASSSPGWNAVKWSGTSGPRCSANQRRELVELAVGVVLAGDQQRRDLEPDRGLAAQIDERVEHGVEVAAADLAVEALGERLEVDVGGVHVPVELARAARGRCSRRSPPPP